MGAKGGNKKGPNMTPNRGSMTLRQQAALEKQGSDKNVNVSFETMLKLDHLKNSASWAATDARIPQLAAFYGHRYAATSEAAGVPPDPSLFYCERCEAILEPGTNCKVRIEPNKSKRRRRRKNSNNPPPQNYVIYTCKVCFHRNKMRGTPKGYVNEICSPKDKQHTSTSNPSSESADINISIDARTCIVEDTKGANIDLPIVTGESGQPNKLLTPLPCTALSLANGVSGEPNKPLTPLPNATLSLLESKMLGRRSGAKKTAKRKDCSSEANGENSMAASSMKKRRKSWTSLKEIAERDHRQQNVGQKFSNFSIPFDLMQSK